MSPVQEIDNLSLDYCHKCVITFCSPRNMEIVVGMTLNSDNLEKYHLAGV